MADDKPDDKPRLGIGDVLRHLVAHGQAYGEDNRTAMLEAVNAEYPPPAVEEPELTPEQQKAKDDQAAKDGRIAELEAELAAARAGAGQPLAGQPQPVIPLAPGQ
jgi:hypothetical protein